MRQSIVFVRRCVLDIFPLTTDYRTVECEDEPAAFSALTQF